MKNTITLPTLLTLIRLIFSPLILPLLFVHYLPHNSLNTNILIAILFSLFGMTDFFDGFLARRYSQETLLGRVLDPIADKFLVFSSLIALLAVGKIHYYWVILLIGREFFVMGLRQIALEYQLRIQVSLQAKLKTALQMIMLLYLIVNPYQALEDNAWGWNTIEQALIVVTVGLALYSAAQYYRSFWITLREKL